MAKKSAPKKGKQPAKKVVAPKKPVKKVAPVKKSPQKLEKQKVKSKEQPKKKKSAPKMVVKQAVKTKKVIKSGSSTKKSNKAQKSKKKTSPAKKSRKGMSLAEKKKTISKKKIARGSSRFRTIQAILGNYGKEQGIKFGKDFNKMASHLHEKVKGTPLKYVEDNIAMLYERYLKPASVEHEFPDGFEFYMFTENLSRTVFNRIKIEVYFKDEQEEFSYVGFSNDVEMWYKDILHPYLRMHYNESPVAVFEISDTDNKTYVKYNVVTGTEAMIPEDLTKIPELPKKEEVTPPVIPSAPSEIDKQIEFEKEKGKTLEKQIEYEKQQQRTIELRTAELQAKLATINKLIDLGYTKDEIKDMLK